MNWNTLTLIACLGLFLAACKADPAYTEEETAPETEMVSLPFTDVAFTDLSAFQDPGANWQIAGEAYVDRSKDQTMEASEGQGVLINLPTDAAKANLFTTMEHGDLELEVEVMMPKGSNSGIYFQSRYEIQLLDSWGVENPRHSDIGGIYQRWDDSKPEGSKGFEGHPPRMNAAKAPGLWQHFRIVFRAPRFDGNGQKTENARFEEVWLNGVLLHENVEVSGPTRSAAFEDETARAPLMIQGDHGPVAFRNLRYKQYDNGSVTISNLQLAEYENESPEIPDLNTLTPKQTVATDTISYHLASTREKYLLAFTGDLNIPVSGAYLFSVRVNQAALSLSIDNNKIMTLDDDSGFEETHRVRVTLEKGTVPFELLFNKARRWWARGLVIEVEGPGIKKHALHAPGSAMAGPQPEPIVVDASDEPVMQRCFLMHEGEKRTHVIAVSTPQGINYAYDLAMGALLQVWGGDFLDATDMWHQRGNAQLGEPRGPVISLHGQPNVAFIGSESASWPDSLKEGSFELRQLGYELNDQGLPVFAYETGGLEVHNELIPAASERRLSRKVSLTGNKAAWLKIDEGSSIKQLPDGSYAIDNYDYFVEVKAKSGQKIVVRTNNGKSELLVNVDAGAEPVEYDIIW